MGFFSFLGSFYTQIKFLSWLGHPPFFSLFTVACVSWYWVAVGRIEKKKTKTKTKTKKITRSLRIVGPRIPGRRFKKVNIHIFGLTKCTIYCEKCSCFCSCFSLCCLTTLIFQIKRIISSEKWCNYVVTFFFFFWKCQKFGSVGRR